MLSRRRYRNATASRCRGGSSSTACISRSTCSGSQPPPSVDRSCTSSANCRPSWATSACPRRRRRRYSRTTFTAMPQSQASASDPAFQTCLRAYARRKTSCVASAASSLPNPKASVVRNTSSCTAAANAPKAASSPADARSISALIRVRSRSIAASDDRPPTTASCTTVQKGSEKFGGCQETARLSRLLPRVPHHWPSCLRRGLAVREGPPRSHPVPAGSKKAAHDRDSERRNDRHPVRTSGSRPTGAGWPRAGCRPSGS